MSTKCNNSTIFKEIIEKKSSNSINFVSLNQIKDHTVSPDDDLCYDRVTSRKRVSNISFWVHINDLSRSSSDLGGGVRIAKKPTGFFGTKYSKQKIVLRLS